MIRYQLRSWLSSRSREGEFGNRTFGAGPFAQTFLRAAQDDAAKQSICARPGENRFFIGIDRQHRDPPRPTRLSTARRCGLASPSGIVEAPSFAFSTDR